MDVYQPKNEKLYRFALMVNGPDGGRKQRVVNTGTANRRIAQEIMRKTAMLSEYVEAGLPPTAELREWLEKVNPKLRKRLEHLDLVPKDVSLQITAITEHTEAYFRACRYRGDGAGFIKVKRRQLSFVFAKAEIQTLSQLKADRVKPVLEHLQDEGKSNRTVNTFRSALNAFANWLVIEGHLEKHDLKRLPRLDEMADRRHPRRPATDEQVRRLLDSVPDHRRFVYMAAVMTGLRRGELRQIERRDIDLVAKTLRVRAEVSKNREEAILPLHDEMVVLLRGKLALLEPADRVFDPIPNILTYQRDLERAGIEYKDENGRYFDFHSLRGTFATRLLRHGVFPSKAIRLTRHKSVKTLENFYDMLGLSDAEEAMGQLPGIGKGDDEPSE